MSLGVTHCLNWYPSVSSGEAGSLSGASPHQVSVATLPFTFHFSPFTPPAPPHCHETRPYPVLRFISDRLLELLELLPFFFYP